jgi:transcriptional regulator with XRE-family HTH domain
VSLDLTQEQLADAVGLHRGHLANIEAGRANISADLMETLAEALGQRLELVVHPPTFIADRRSHDTVHAWCSGYVARRMLSDGWRVAREVDAAMGQVRGWIDLLAFHPARRILLIIEIKTRLDDLGGLERQVGWYERRAAEVAARHGWRARRVATWVVVLASDEIDRIAATNREVLSQAFPGRAGEMLAVLTGADPTVGRSLAMVDPAGRRRRWLLPTRLDGRRSGAPYRDYADAARRMQERGR